METWSFNVVMSLVEAPDFMFYEGFFDDCSYEVLFNYKGYDLVESEIISATAFVREVELFLYFETTYDYRDVFKVFCPGRLYRLSIKINGQLHEVVVKLIDMYYPDDFDHENTRTLYLEIKKDQV